MNTRRATSGDADALTALNAHVQNLHAEAVPELFKPATSGVFYAPAPLEVLLTEPHNHVFVVDVGSKPIGYVWAQIRERPENVSTHAQYYLVIEHIAVSPDHQKQGAGAMLINQVKSLAKELGVTSVVLNVWSFNAKAHAFFASQGFADLDQRMSMRVDVLHD